MKALRLCFGSDHAGLALRQALAEAMRTAGHAVREVGATSGDPYDYPDASDLVARAVLEQSADFGVLVCGSGVGVSIRANRYFGIRAANCCSVEMARLSRQHNHTNILCLGERLVELGLAESILNAFLTTEEDTAERHCRRVDKLDREIKE